MSGNRAWSGPEPLAPDVTREITLNGPGAGRARTP